ncbi:hypothetical protein [Rhizomonospora bruguierae]|uniref:hypothetical protein n=1 Tax=Rhizomonospora bruguierae TaxID=1581705 RepID=UPI001BCEBAB6|nr:hypothetical protein [Micromonospora sp. NBRC 107566]
MTGDALLRMMRWIVRRSLQVLTGIAALAVGVGGLMATAGAPVSQGDPAPATQHPSAVSIATERAASISTGDGALAAGGAPAAPAGAGVVREAADGVDVVRLADYAAGAVRVATTGANLLRVAAVGADAGFAGDGRAARAGFAGVALPAGARPVDLLVARSFAWRSAAGDLAAGRSAAPVGLRAPPHR